MRVIPPHSMFSLSLSCERLSPSLVSSLPLPQIPPPKEKNQNRTKQKQNSARYVSSSSSSSSRLYDSLHHPKPMEGVCPSCFHSFLSGEKRNIQNNVVVDDHPSILPKRFGWSGMGSTPPDDVTPPRGDSTSNFRPKKHGGGVRGSSRS